METHFDILMDRANQIHAQLQTMFVDRTKQHIFMFQQRIYY